MKSTKQIPQTQVSAKPTRRRFGAQYKLDILEEADRAAPGEIGAILRREGLYSSHLANWREARQEGALGALKKKRGRRPTKRNPLEKKVARLTREKAQLELQLRQAKMVIEIQKKVAALLGIEMTPPPSGSDGRDS